MTIEEILKTKIRGEAAIKFPLSIDWGRITDADGNMVLDVRGWGHYQYHEKGQEIQDTIGQWVVDTLNEKASSIETK